jgi:membrane-associated protease RseP (regulator of RpoE activity)
VSRLTAIVVAAACLAGHSARAQEVDAPATVLEVEVSADAAETMVLLDRGRTQGLERGRTVELRRDDRTVGYGTVVMVFDSKAVANVGTVVTGASPLRPGDEIRFHGAGFRGPAEPAQAPDEPAEPAQVLPSGQVVGVREKVILVDFGEQAGGRAGDQVSIRDESGEVGRVEIQLVDGSTSVGTLVRGQAEAGDRAVTVARGAAPERGIDFVALSFLGVVADLEHPTPHRAPCHVGVPVRRIMRGSPAQRGGIGPGDRVIAIDGQLVRDVATIRERIESRASATVRVALLRGEQLMFVDVSFR